MKMPTLLRASAIAAALAGLTSFAGAPALAASTPAAAQPPTVTITSVVNALPGTIPDLGVPFLINATASDPDGRVTRVEFFVGSTRYGTDFNSPYQYKITDAAVNGTVTLTAKAYDNDNLSTVSAPVTVAIKPSKYVYRGIVTAGAETGCLVLPSGGKVYLLLAGDWASVLAVGYDVVVTGQEHPELATTCQQGIPLTVSSAVRMPSPVS